ncbi:YhhA family cyclophane-containing RiPP [Streptomyces sp. NBC_00343]|uniref:YhhA family cyclophane-containing RiPP n=1 Tax=Streptomyces sp. NBC_00343 TaxID=2975719 RepID=UPI003FA6B0B7
MATVDSADTTAASAPTLPSPEIDSVALRRLIEEVRTSEPVVSSSYNRTHNRHNR